MFKKTKPEKKSYYGTVVASSGDTNCDETVVPSLTARLAWNKYEVVAPVNKGVNEVSGEISCISPVIRSKDDDTIVSKPEKRIDSSGVLKLLQSPTLDKTWSDFSTAIVNSQIVTGNVYMVVQSSLLRGKGGKSLKKAEPVSLYYAKPQDVMPIVGNGQHPSGYIWFDGASSKTFKRDIYGRYYTNDFEYELWHVADFNPSYGMGCYEGLSRLTSIYHEIDQFMLTNIHNSSVLKKEARPSGIAFLHDEFDANAMMDGGQTAFEVIKSQFDNFFSGASNSGKVIVGNGVKDFKQLSLTAKDMDFANLKAMCRDQIYSNLNIPLPMVNADTMSYNNFSEARIIFYTKTIVPMLKRVFNELTRFLMPRYKDGDNWKISFDPSEIPALQELEIKNQKEKLEAGLIATNEARIAIGEDEVDGGGVIYISKNMMPINSWAVVDTPEPIEEVEEVETVEPEKEIEDDKIEDAVQDDKKSLEIEPPKKQTKLSKMYGQELQNEVDSCYK